MTLPPWLAASVLCCLITVVGAHRSDITTDPANWEYSNGSYVGEVSTAGDVPHGNGNMSWTDGRAVEGRWEDGCPVEATVHIPPRDTYK